MTREEAIEKLKSIDLIGSNEDIEFQYALDMGIEALEKINKIDKIAHIRSVEDLNGLNCEEAILGLFKTVLERCEITEDAISRQAVLDEIGRRDVKTLEAYKDYSKLYDFVNTLPSVKPVEKVGHWIFRFRNGFGRALYKCSECDFDYDATGYNYCPNCGAKMQEVKNEQKGK